MLKKYRHLSLKMKDAIVKNGEAITDLADLLHEAGCADIFCINRDQKKVPQHDDKSTPRTV